MPGRLPRAGGLGILLNGSVGAEQIDAVLRDNEEHAMGVRVNVPVDGMTAM